MLKHRFRKPVIGGEDGHDLWYHRPCLSHCFFVPVAVVPLLFAKEYMAPEIINRQPYGLMVDWQGCSESLQRLALAVLLEQFRACLLPVLCSAGTHPLLLSAYLQRLRATFFVACTLSACKVVFRSSCL